MLTIMKNLFTIFVLFFIFGVQALTPEEESSLRAALGDEYDQVMAATQGSAAQGAVDAGIDVGELGLSDVELQEALEAEIKRAQERAGAAPVPSGAAASGGQGMTDAELAILLQQEEEDARFARQLQQQEQAEERARRQQAEEEGARLARQLQQQAQAEQDAALAARLAAMDLEDAYGGAAAVGHDIRPHPIATAEERKKFYADLPNLHAAYNEQVKKMPCNAAGEYEIDVHQYNRIIKGTFDTYVALDGQAIKTRADHDWQAIHAILTQFINAGDHFKERYQHALPFMNGKGKAYLQSGAVDPEIGQNYRTLLSRCWDLILRVSYAGPTQEITFNGEKHHVSVMAMEKLAYAYHENIATQGGCAPGFAGRLAKAYIELLNHML